jgi:hypothetical protein
MRPLDEEEKQKVTLTTFSKKKKESRFHAPEGPIYQGKIGSLAHYRVFYSSHGHAIRSLMATWPEKVNAFPVPALLTCTCIKSPLCITPAFNEKSTM